MSRHACWMALCLLLPVAALAEPTRSEARERLAATGVEVDVARLVQFAASGDVATVELLLAAGLKADAAEPLRKVTALHNASAQGHRRLVERLLERGANVDAPDWTGATPLIHAAYAGQVTAAGALLEAGAGVDVVPASGPTALIAAIQSGKVELVQRLLAKGADPSLASAHGDTPLEAARRRALAPVEAMLQAAIAARPGVGQATSGQEQQP